jgi:histidinol-phosphatase (PHP family)
VLTDYHLHLRPDESPEPAFERWFTEANVELYLEAAREAGIEELGVSEHIYRFRQALELWDHPFWRRQAHDDLDAYCEFVRSTPLRLGIELDYIPGADERAEEMLGGRDFDYVVGSVHFIGEGYIDMDEYGVWVRGQDPDLVWRRYFEAIATAARSGLFDILAHPDLVKVWGGERPGPKRDPRHYYEPAVEAIAESGIAVEVSTAGLRKPVGEIYPAPAFAEMCAEAGAAFALSSDAHAPEQVGYAYNQALTLLESLEVTDIAVFDRRRRRMEPFPRAQKRENPGS